jgi:hypothetical protein
VKGVVVTVRDNVHHRASVVLDRAHPIQITMLDLTDDEKLALVAELKRTIDEDRYPMSHRMQTLKAILAKLEPAPAVAADCGWRQSQPIGRAPALAAMKRRRRG